MLLLTVVSGEQQACRFRGLVGFLRFLGSAGLEFKVSVDWSWVYLVSRTFEVVGSSTLIGDFEEMLEALDLFIR